MDVDNVQNILSNIFRPPVAIPELYEHISETCSNYWNEIISTYDPIKNKRLIKSKQNLKTFSILVFITFATVIKNYNSKRDSNIHQVRISKDLTKIGLLFKKEEEEKKRSAFIQVQLQKVPVRGHSLQTGVISFGDCLHQDTLYFINTGSRS